MSRELCTRFSLLQPDREKSVADKQALQKSSHDRRAHSHDWIVGDRVMVCNLRPKPDWVPSTIVEVLGPFTYVIETEQGQHWKRHADQLKNWLPVATSVDTSEDVPDPELEDMPGEPVVDPEHTEEAETPEDTSPPETESTKPRYPQRNRSLA